MTNSEIFWFLHGNFKEYKTACNVDIKEARDKQSNKKAQLHSNSKVSWISLPHESTIREIGLAGFLAWVMKLEITWVMYGLPWEGFQDHE